MKSNMHTGTPPKEDDTLIRCSTTQPQLTIPRARKVHTVDVPNFHQSSCTSWDVSVAVLFPHVPGNRSPQDGHESTFAEQGKKERKRPDDLFKKTIRVSTGHTAQYGSLRSTDDQTCPAASVALAGAPDDDQTVPVITSRTGDVVYRCGSSTVTRTHAEQGLPRSRRRQETTTHFLRADLFYTTTLSLQRRGVTGDAQAAIAAASAAGQQTS